jgi:cell division transport system permease protein
LYYANLYIPELTRLQREEEIAIIFLATLIFGGLLGVLSTYRAVRKYLKMSLDDLY